jgi:hypothetical protein
MRLDLSIHEDLTKDLEIKSSSDRSFGFVFAVVFAILGFFPYLAGSGQVHIWAFFASVILLIISFTKPSLLAPFNRIWTRIGLLLQKVVSPVVLGVMFYLIITPFGLVMRMLGNDLLSLKLDKSALSYWIHRTPPGPSPKSMKNQY